MSAAVHHFGVVLRLMATTRGGLVALLALVNCLPMVAMPMFSRAHADWFAGAFTVDAFVLSVGFAPICRWALGSCLGQRGGRTAAALLPMSPRARAVAETAGVLVAVWVPAVAVVAIVAGFMAIGLDADVAGVVGSLALLCAGLSTLSLPHLLLASLDREAAYSRRMWIRWLAAPVLTAAALAVPAAHSLPGYALVGLLAAAVTLAWGPAPWLDPTGRGRRRVLANAGPVTRKADSDPAKTLSHDFRRGLRSGALRGLGWALALVVPLVVARWWRFPEIATASALVIAATIAGRYPLGLPARVVGGPWATNGDFGRAWSVLPIPASAVARAVYLHVALCSGVVVLVGLAAFTSASVWFPTEASRFWTTTGLLLVVTGLALVGIRTHSAVGSVRAWQWSWVVGGASVGCVWAVRVGLDLSRSPLAEGTLVAVAVLGALAVAVSPWALTRRPAPVTPLALAR
ncbi:MAG: hypothetical protein AAF721_20680 [Myxococcota bacterium]